MPSITYQKMYARPLPCRWTSQLFSTWYAASSANQPYYCISEISKPMEGGDSPRPGEIKYNDRVNMNRSITLLLYLLLIFNLFQFYCYIFFHVLYSITCRVPIFPFRGLILVCHCHQIRPRLQKLVPLIGLWKLVPMLVLTTTLGSLHQVRVTLMCHIWDPCYSKEMFLKKIWYVTTCFSISPNFLMQHFVYRQFYFC